MKRGKTPPIAIEEVSEEVSESSSKSTSEEDEIVCQTPLRQSPVDESTDSVSEADTKCRRRCICSYKCVAISSSIMSVILLAIVIILAYHLGALRYCFRGAIIPRDPGNRPRVFEDMTVQEFYKVRDYMLYTSKIGLVPIEEASVNSSYIYMIDLHIPLKSAVLEYLDRGSKQLERAAKVVVVRGDLVTPRVEEYLVAPLSNPRRHRLARNPAYVRYPIPFSSRPVDQVEFRHLYPILTRFSEQIYHILMESYGLCYHNCTKGYNCLRWHDVAPRGRESGDRKSWFWSFRDVEGFYLHPLGLELQINHESTDVSEWQIERIVYNGQLVYNVENLIEKYNSNKIRKTKIERPVGRFDELYSSYYRRRPSEMPVPMPGPRFVEPDGHRYDINGQHVKYMHWDFDVRMRSSTGLQIFDVRFQSERLAYEISLQDAVVFLSGYGPAQSMSNYYDTSWLMGASSFELVPGVDCPETAAFLDSVHFANNGSPVQYRRTICIFEHNPGIPLRRHYANDYKNGYTHYGGLVDYQLVVRHISTIWNHDYIFDYIFHLNGHIEVKVATTGYVQSTYKLMFGKQFGNEIFYDVMADIHQHLFHFKIDLDIGGLKNSYSLLNIDTATMPHPWYAHVNKTQLVITESKMKREMDSIVDESDNPKYHVIYSDRALNKYNNRRGYRIINNAQSKFLLSDIPVTNAAKWAKYPIIVTKYDDTEEQSSSIFAQNDPWDPVVDFERFVLDNDTILYEDLVTWVTVGGHHIPHTEDVPSPSTSWNQYVFHLVPFNFFTECPSVSSPNAVHITPNDNYNNINVNTFGTSYDVRCVPQSFGPHEYYGYRKTV